MLLTSTFVNAHALSHLFDQDDVSDIENCEFCDEYVVNHQKDLNFHFNSTEFDISLVEIPKTEAIQLVSTSILLNAKPQGKFYNKPPPFLKA